MLRHTSSVERSDDVASEGDEVNNPLLHQVAPHRLAAARARPWRDSCSPCRLQCTALSWLLTAACLLLCGVVLALLSTSPTFATTSQSLSSLLSFAPSAEPYSATLLTYLSALPPALNYQHANHTCVLWSHDPAYPPCPLPPAPPLPASTHITAAFTVCGSEVQQFALTHLKSWLLQQPRNTTYEFYVLSDDVAKQTAHFERVVSRWPRRPTLHWLDILSLPPLYQSYLNEFKRCATARVYLPLLLPPHVHRIAYLDVDTVLVNDPRRLWRHFDLFTANRTLLAFAWETSYADVKDNWYLKQPTAFPFVPPWGLNSGVMLMDVAAVRGWRWRGRNYTESVLAVFEEWRGKLKLGDQDCYNVLLGLARRDTGGGGGGGGGGGELYLPLSESVNWRVGSGQPGGPDWAGGGGGVGSNGEGWDDGGVVVLHGNDRRFVHGNVWLENLYRTFYYWQGWPSVP